MHAGDRIGYSASFVRSIGATFELAERRGTVEAADERVATVRWDDDPDEPGRVLVRNIARIGSARFADATIG